MNNLSVSDRVAASFAAKRSSNIPGAHIVKSALVSSEIAKVLVALNFDGGPQANREAIASLLGERAQPIADSFVPVAGSGTGRGQTLLVGFVGANVLSEELTDERKAGMTAISANVLLDQHDQTMWQITKASDGRSFIHRQHNEDLAEVMAETASVSFATTIPQRFHDLGQYTVATVSEGSDPRLTYAKFVNPEDHSIGYGYVLEHASADNDYKVGILRRDAHDEIAYVNEEMLVTCAFDVDDNNRLTTALNKHAQEVTAGLTGADSDAMKRYFAKEFGYSPQFLRLLEDEIDQQARA